MSTEESAVRKPRIQNRDAGHYNKYKKSPFETFYMGGDGMTGYRDVYKRQPIYKAEINVHKQVPDSLQWSHRGSLSLIHIFTATETLISLEQSIKKEIPIQS